MGLQGLVGGDMFTHPVSNAIPRTPMTCLQMTLRSPLVAVWIAATQIAGWAISES